MLHGLPSSAQAPEPEHSARSTNTPWRQGSTSHVKAATYCTRVRAREDVTLMEGVKVRARTVGRYRVVEPLDGQHGPEEAASRQYLIYNLKRSGATLQC